MNRFPLPTAADEQAQCTDCDFVGHHEQDLHLCDDEQYRCEEHFLTYKEKNETIKN